MYLTAAGIENQCRVAAAFQPSYFRYVEMPETSVEGATIGALHMRVGPDLGPRPSVLFIGGTHARELMNPDAVLELAIDLFVAHANRGDLTFGSMTWSHADVIEVLELLDLWFLPCVNPDGRKHVMEVDDMWRKNRAELSGVECEGVDLNRNLDILWGVTTEWEYRNQRIETTSCDPCSDLYVGPHAFSEPETRNIKHLLDEHDIDCLVDVHSFSELVLFPWGHAPTQTTDRSMRFTTLPNATCELIENEDYREFMPADDLITYHDVSAEIVDAIEGVRGRRYQRRHSYGLYGTTGTVDDYAYSRHMIDRNANKTWAFTFETGPRTGDDRESFHPDDPTAIKDEAKSGMFALAQQCVRRLRPVDRDVLVTVDFDGRNDERFGGDHFYDPGPIWFRPGHFSPASPLTYSWSRELRAEYTFDYDFRSTGGFKLRCDGKLFEGTSESTTDLDGQGSIDIEVGPGDWATGVLHISNTDEGDPDDFGRLRIVVQNNDVGKLNLFSMWHPGRRDNHVTSNPRHARERGHRPDGYGFYRRQGIVLDPDGRQPPGTVALRSWWNPSRLDNWATTDPEMAGRHGTSRDGYVHYRVEGFIFDPDRRQPAGTVPLTTWWHPGRRDHFSSTRAKWQRPIGTVQEGYTAIRLEGFVLQGDPP